MAFEHVVTEATILGKIRKELAWQIIRDYKRYPEMMENVDGVEIHTQDEISGKSEWFINVEGAPLRWVEKDYFDKESYAIRFESIDGDFDNINGKWRIEDYEGKGIKIFFRIDYNLGIPVIEEVLGHILKDKMKSNIDLMISAITKELGQIETEERQHERIIINTYNTLTLNNKEFRAFIANVSRGGMQFYYEDELDESDVNLALNHQNIKANVLYNDVKRKSIRLIFDELLSEQELKSLITFIEASHIRKNPRMLVEKKVRIGLDGETLHLYLVDISRKGICFQYNGEKKPFGNAFTLLDKTISVSKKWLSKDERQIRLIFSTELSEHELLEIMHKLTYE